MLYRRGYRDFIFGICRLALIFAVSVLVSCQSVRGPDVEEQVGGIEIRGLRILNRSFGTVTEVQLLVTRTGEFISCGNIAMRGQCSTTFPLRQYQGNQIEIRWKQGSSEWSTGEFVVEANERIDPSRPAIVQVILNSQGLAPTELVQ